MTDMRAEDMPVVDCVLKEQAAIPMYGSETASGADMRAYIEAPVVISPGERKLISTGVRFAVPEGFEGQVRPRSGLALKHGVTVLNSPGTIDSDYRGEVMVLLINLGNEPFQINPGDRIAQFVVSPVVRAVFRSCGELKNSGRGSGGFGSTGIT